MAIGDAGGSTSPGDPNPGIEPKSLASQADSLPSEPSGKPKEQYTKPMFFRQHKMKQEGQ